MLRDILFQVLYNSNLQFAVGVGILSFVALWLCEVSE